MCMAVQTGSTAGPQGLRPVCTAMHMDKVKKTMAGFLSACFCRPVAQVHWEGGQRPAKIL